MVVSKLGEDGNQRSQERFNNVEKAKFLNRALIYTDLKSPRLGSARKRERLSPLLKREEPSNVMQPVVAEDRCGMSSAQLEIQKKEENNIIDALM